MRIRILNILKRPISLIVIGIIILICFIGIIIINKNNKVLSNQTIDGLSFENANLEYKDGISTFTVEVENQNKESYHLKTITINIKNRKEEVITLTGYIGEVIENQEIKYLKASINREIKDIVSLEYVINK